MEKPPNVGQSAAVYYRLIALWVVCEALLGGIIHGLKLPVSGLVVGSSAVICICLIACHVPHKGAILKATLTVAIFKMMLSPHSPLPAYFAVFFQGVLGELLFFRRVNYKLSCVLLGLFALLESALQRILVMTLIYGADVWTAINDFIRGFTKDAADYSYGLIVFYLAAHALTGIFIGWFASGLPARMHRWNREELLFEKGHHSIAPSSRQNKKLRPVFFIVWILLGIVFLQSSLGWGQPVLSSNRVVQLLVRSALLLLSWYLVISPLLTLFLKRWLSERQQRSARLIAEITALLPSTKYLVIKSWELSASRKGLKRFRFFCQLVVTNTLADA